jgi:hypothetical protein
MVRSIIRPIAKWTGIVFSAFVAVLFAAWFIIFKWNIIPYPSDSAYGPEICYSPNHQYYVKRYQSIFQSGMDQLYAEGLAVLYDAKTDKEIFRGYAPLSEMAGPNWHHDGVGYQGMFDWFAKLPCRS